MIKRVILFLSFNIFLLFSNELQKYKLSLSFYNDGFFEQSENSFKEFIKEYPESVYKNKSLFYLSLSQIKLKKNFDAIKNFLVLSNNKDFEYYSDVIYYLAITYFLVDDFNNSEKFAKESLSIYNKKDSIREKVLYVSILNNINLNKLDYALKLSKEYFETIEFKSYRYDIQKYLSNYFMENNLYFLALQIYETILIERSGVDEKLIKHNYLLCLAMLNRNRDAIDFFYKRINYYDEEVYTLIGDILFKEREYKRAIDVFERVYNNSNKKEILYKIGLIYIEQKEYKKAIDAFQRKREEFLDMLSDLYYRIGDNKKSYEYLLKIDNNNLDDRIFIIKFKLAIEFNDKKIIREFYNYLDRIKKLSDKEKNPFLYKLGEFFYNDKDYKKSDDVLRIWLTYFLNDPNYDKVLYMRGVILKKNNNYNDAIVEFSKIQKLKKMDEIYYESFVEKGECYFLLMEYHSAIECYKVYLNNKKYLLRARETELQLGNAYYNIKRYKDAYLTYVNYIKKWGEKKEIFDKIANSLLKSENYDEIILFFKDRKNTGEFSEYLMFYANYKKSNFLNVINDFRNYTNIKSQYYIDIAYLSVLSRFQINNYESFKEETDRVIYNIKNHSDKDKINSLYKEYFKSFVRINELSLAYRLFKDPENEIIFYMAETLYKYLYFKESGELFNRIVVNNYYKNLTEKNIMTMIDCFIRLEDKEKVKILFDFLFAKFGEKREYIVKLFSFAVSINEIEFIRPYLFHNNKIFSDYANYSIKYTESKNRDEYINNLKKIVNISKIDDLFATGILLEIVRLEYLNKNYKEVISIVSKIPEKKLLEVSPEFRFLMAYSYYYLNEENKSIEEFLKIFYLYSFDFYWVEKSIKSILDIYRKSNNEEKYQQVKKMFEDKFFKLRE